MADKSFWGDKKDKTWLKNFWFYYQKAVIISILIIIFVIYACVECARKIDYDLISYYFSSVPLSTEVTDNASIEFQNIIDDADGKDGKNAYCYNLVAYDPQYNAEYSYATNTKIQLEISEGDGYLYIMDDDFYKLLLEYDVLEDISHITENEEEPYALEITDNKYMNSLGFDVGEKLYMGVRVHRNNRIGKEKYEIMHNNALNVIEYVCANK